MRKLRSVSVSPPADEEENGESRAAPSSQPSRSMARQRSLRRFQLMFFIVFIIALAGAGTSLYLWRQLHSMKKDPTQSAMAETKSIIEEVGKLIVLPTDEEPTIATVTDPEKLKDQPFFARAQSGDKVLIYYKAKKAILYNPSGRKIVEVAPVNNEAPQVDAPR